MSPRATLLYKACNGQDQVLADVKKRNHNSHVLYRKESAALHLRQRWLQPAPRAVLARLLLCRAPLL